LDAAGVVGAAGTPQVAGLLPVDLAVDTAGLAVYATNLQDATMSQFNISLVTGVITPMTPATVVTGIAPRAGIMHPSGRHFYVTAGGVPGDGPPGDDLIGQFRVHPTTRALTSLTTAQIEALGDPHALAVSPNGKYLVVTNDTTGLITVYEINTTAGNIPEDGELLATAVDGATPNLNPRSLAFSMDGSMLYVGTDSTGMVEAYTFSSTGQLGDFPDVEITGGVVHSIVLRHTIQ
jgi:6-phosphogluconolactonase (cycloisomerase 2 family)